MDNFKNMYYMLTVILKKYVSQMCMSYIAKNIIVHRRKKSTIHAFSKLSADELMIRKLFIT